MYAKGHDKQNILTHQTEVGETVLHEAVKNSGRDSVAQLLEWGVEAGVNLLDIKNDETRKNAVGFGGWEAENQRDHGKIQAANSAIWPECIRTGTGTADEIHDEKGR
mmetsp:Transcript_25253/g.62558  ORF Transcript_25253/g.62558 Transcript_25253/m.62558 type:complete len:107 (-) Transcript_25253:13-333(-)